MPRLSISTIAPLLFSGVFFSCDAFQLPKTPRTPIELTRRQADGKDITRVGVTSQQPGVNNLAEIFFVRTLPDTAKALLPTTPLKSLPNLFGIQATLRGVLALFIPEIILKSVGVDPISQSALLLARLSSIVMILLGSRMSHAEPHEVARIGFFWFSGWASILGYALYNQVASGPVTKASIALHASMAVLAVVKANDLRVGTLKRDLSVKRDEFLLEAKKFEADDAFEASENAVKAVNETAADLSKSIKTEVSSAANKVSEKVDESKQWVASRLSEEINHGNIILRTTLLLQNYAFFLGAWFVPECIMTLFQVPVETSLLSSIFANGLALNSFLFGAMMDRCSDRNLAISGTWYFSGMAIFSVVNSSIGSMGLILKAFFASQVFMAVWSLLSATRSDPKIRVYETNIRQKYVPP